MYNIFDRSLHERSLYGRWIAPAQQTIPFTMPRNDFSLQTISVVVLDILLSLIVSVCLIPSPSRFMICCIGSFFSPHIITFHFRLTNRFMRVTPSKITLKHSSLTTFHPSTSYTTESFEEQPDSPQYCNKQLSSHGDSPVPGHAWIPPAPGCVFFACQRGDSPG